MRRTPLATLALLALAALPAHAGIFRCTSPAGEVTYQQDPCGAREAAKVIQVPESYPAADLAERERLLAREAALDRRLEAQREREGREAIARAMQPPAPPPPPNAQPEVAWIVPPVVVHHRHPFPRRGGMPGPGHY